MTALVQSAAILFGVTTDDILGPSRRAPIARARQAVYYVAHRKFKRGVTDIGREMGRDQRTVRHGIDTVEARMARDADYKWMIGALWND